MLSQLSKLLNQLTPVKFLFLGAASCLLFLVVILIKIDFPPPLSSYETYVASVVFVLSVVFAVWGYLAYRRIFEKVQIGKDIPAEITFVENRRCHVLHQIGISEYSRIAKFRLELLQKHRRADEFGTLLVFAVCAFEPCEIWRMVEQEFVTHSSHLGSSTPVSPTVDELYETARQICPHFELFSTFSNYYPNAVGRLLLLPADWKKRNSREHFELFSRLNGAVRCRVVTTDDSGVRDIQFKTDHTVIDNVLLDYYQDAQTLIISYIDGWQNPQVPNYLLRLQRDVYRARNLPTLDEWRRRNCV
jgi:hypothetical protein